MNSDNRTPLHRNLAVGFLIGIGEACVSHPLWVLKTLSQQKQPLTWNPKVLYRGVGSHAASSVPLDAIQTAMSRIFNEHPYFANWPKAERRLVGGCFGGCFGAMISSPAEMIMTRQLKKEGTTFSVACKDLWQEGFSKKFYTGIGATIGRDSLFCCGFFAAVPILNEKFKKQGVSSVPASIAAGIVSGIFTAIISQPFDTIKTVVQSSSEKISSVATCRQIIQNEGFKGLFNGLALRIGRVTTGVLILGVLNEKLEELFLNKKY